MIKVTKGKCGRWVACVPTASANERDERNALRPFAGRAAATGIAAVHVTVVAAADEHANAAAAAAPDQQ